MADFEAVDVRRVGSLTVDVFSMVEDASELQASGVLLKVKVVYALPPTEMKASIRPWSDGYTIL